MAHKWKVVLRDESLKIGKTYVPILWQCSTCNCFRAVAFDPDGDHIITEYSLEDGTVFATTRAMLGFTGSCEDEGNYFAVNRDELELLKGGINAGL